MKKMSNEEMMIYTALACVFNGLVLLYFYKIQPWAALVNQSLVVPLSGE
jgi:hypothetical protein